MKALAPLIVLASLLAGGALIWVGASLLGGDPSVVEAEGEATADDTLRAAFGDVPALPKVEGRGAGLFDRAKRFARGSAGKLAEPPTSGELDAVGDATIAELRSTLPESEDGAARDRMLRVVEKLLRVRPRDSTLRYSFVLLTSDQPNAFMSPGGRGIVLTPLLERLGSDDELGFILGHEVAHGELGHLREKVHAAKAGQSLGEKIDRAGAKASDLVSRSVRWVLTAPFDQDQEFEADRLGLALAIAAGFDPRGGPAALRKLTTAHERAPEKGVRRIAYDVVGTHPPTAERIAYLEDLIARSARARGR